MNTLEKIGEKVPVSLVYCLLLLVIHVPNLFVKIICGLSAVFFFVAEVKYQRYRRSVNVEE